MKTEVDLLMLPKSTRLWSNWVLKAEAPLSEILSILSEMQRNQLISKNSLLWSSMLLVTPKPLKVWPKSSDITIKTETDSLIWKSSKPWQDFWEKPWTRKKSSNWCTTLTSLTIYRAMKPSIKTNSWPSLTREHDCLISEISFIECNHSLINIISNTTIIRISWFCLFK